MLLAVRCEAGWRLAGGIKGERRAPPHERRLHGRDRPFVEYREQEPTFAG